jgi:16S rRNA processing protein RimM
VPEKPRYFAVARLLRPRGNKGELAAELLTDFPERLTKLEQVFLSSGKAGAEAQPIAVKSCWLSQNHKGHAVFHFAGINSINEAEALRGRDVLLAIEQRVTLPDGKYFVDDLVGCAIYETADPQSKLGEVISVEFPGEDFPGTPLLVVAGRKGPRDRELLIPLAEDICTRIDIANRHIDVVLPEGLRELDGEE